MKRRTNQEKAQSSLNSLSPRNLEEIIDARVQRAMGSAGVSQKMVQQAIVSSSYSGPLPRPEETAKYESILPGFSNRFVTMAEMAQKSDIESNRRRERGEIAFRMSSLVVAAVLGLVPLLGGIWLLSTDKPVSGFTIIAGAAATVIYAVTKGQKKRG